MFIENVKTPKGTIYGVNLEDVETQKLLETLGVNLIDIAKEEIKKRLLQKESSRIQKVLSQYGYFGLDDVRFWNSKDPEDPEPKGLLNWYEAYDNAIWDWIDNELPKYQTVEELISLDLKQIEAQIFEKTKTLLPKED